MIAKIHTLLRTVVYPSLRFSQLAVAALLIIGVGCTADEKLLGRSHPVVSTFAISDINELGATLHGEILDLGDGVTDHGFYYGSYTINPTTVTSCDVISLGPADTAEAFSAPAINDLIKDKIYYVRAFAVSKKTNVIVFGQEMTFTAAGSAAPTIKDFNPKQGIVGDTIIIEGSGYSTVLTNNTAFVGDAYAPVTKVTNDKLWVVVPNSTPLGESDLVVSVSDRKVTATSKFSLMKMTVTSFEPNLVAFGDTVWFHGTNLPLVKDMSAATIFLRSAHTGSTTRTLIGCVVPNDAAETSSDITLVVGTQSAHFNGPIKLKGPVITSFDPVSGVAGTVVTINGANFNPDLTRNTVSFGANAIQILEASGNRLLVRIPTNANPGSAAFTVSTLIALITTSSGSFTVTPQ